jgi:hypothetical protein
MANIWPNCRGGRSCGFYNWMIDSPDAVYLIIPAMKELGMSWTEIKQTPRYEIMGLIGALRQHEILHAYDGYTEKDIGDMAKDRPELRSSYNQTKLLKEKYLIASGKKKQIKTFHDIMSTGVR